MSLLINRLLLSQFGGINGTVDLDLSAPLTLIFAPNGTGKTSLIEGINWAFCSADVREPRCRLAESSVATRVSISIQRPTKVESFTRQVESDGSEARTVDDGPSEPTEYLKRMAPDCDVGHLHHLSQKKRLVEHLSRNRVLLTHTLAHLIDETEASARTEAMAELLGTRAQENALTQLDQYDRRLDKRLTDLRISESSKLVRKDSIIAGGAEPTVDMAQLTAQIVLVFGSAGVFEGGDGQLALEAAWSERHASVTSKLSACEALAEILEGGLPQDVLNKVQAEEANELKAADALSQIIALKSALSLEGQGQLAQRRKEQGLLTTLGAAVREVGMIVDEQAPSSTWSDVLQGLNTVHELFGSAEEARIRFQDLQQKLPNWQTTLTQLNTLDREVSGLQRQLLKSRPLTEIATALQDVRAKQAEADRATRSFDGARATMVQALELLKEQRPMDCHCPACGSDWRTRPELDAAIERTFAAVSQSAKEVASQQAALQDQERALALEQTARSILETSVAMIVKQQAALIEVERTISSSAKVFGVTALQSDALSRWGFRIKVAECLGRVDDVGLKPFESCPQPDPSQPVSTWLTILRADAIARRNDISRLTREVSALDSEKAVAEVQLKETNSRLQQVRLRHSAAQAVLRKVIDLQRQLSVPEVNRDVLDSVRGKLQAEMDTLRRSQALLNVRKQALQTRKGLEEIERLNSELAPLQACIKKVEDEQLRCAAISAQIRQATSQLRKAISVELSPTVSQLFQRMQVNRVFSDVRIDDQLHLAGVLAGREMDPGKFSAGQRQDLALAFFLARSYAMGGSFFLDEPLAHLDDINRVALLDTLRAFVMAASARVQATRLTITTASWQTARHVMEKFIRIDRGQSSSPSLRVYQLRGNVQSTVSADQVYPKVMIKPAAVIQ